jgi:hypothetical protein
MRGFLSILVFRGSRIMVGDGEVQGF